MSKRHARTTPAQSTSTDTSTGVAGAGQGQSGPAAGGSLGNQATLELMRGSSETDASIANGINSSTPGVRASTNKYTIVRGDTLSRIARRAGQADWQPLYDLNRDKIMDPNRLSVGQVLVLPEGWAVAGAVNDPNNLEGDPLALANTEYAGASLGMGVQVNADGSTTKVEELTQGAETDVDKKVEVLHDFADPIEYEEDKAPAESELFVEDEAGTEIKKQQGSVAGPTTWRMPLEGNMFVGGSPAAADVRQGGLGDCFYQADLLGIVQQDPGKISSMMDYTDERATVRFFRKNAAGAWVQTTVTVTNDLMVKSRDKSDLKGADVRVGEAARRVGWYADIDGNKLEVSKDEYYEWALWAPLLEKAYARFAEQYGKYGDAAAQPAGSGYNEIESGKARHVFQVFYGSEVDNLDATSVSYSPDADNVAANIDALKQLVQFSEQKGRPGAAGGEQTFLSAKIGDDDAIERLEPLVDAALGTHWEWPWNEDKLTPALEKVRDAIDTWTAAKTDLNKQSIVDATTKLTSPGVHTQLTADGAPAEYQRLNEVAGIVINIGSDNHPGRRMVYSSHQYNIKDVSWAYWMGLPLAINSGNVETVAPFLDVNTTKVMLQNPHARNEPDLDGDGPDLDRVDEGQFEMSLDQVFRCFSWFETTVIDHDPA